MPAGNGLLDWTKAAPDFYFPMNDSPPQTNNEYDLNVERVTQRAADIESKLPKLKALFEQGKLMLAMVKDYWRGSYREIPHWAIGATALALLYVLNPADLFPDFIPGVGHLDDAAVVAFCLKLIEKEIGRYQQWRVAKARSPDGKIIDV
jgi:uncharacterized membrane protein YkvA (DUF1232 family)